MLRLVRSRIQRLEGSHCLPYIADDKRSCTLWHQGSYYCAVSFRFKNDVYDVRESAREFNASYGVPMYEYVLMPNDENR